MLSESVFDHSHFSLKSPFRSDWERFQLLSFMYNYISIIHYARCVFEAAGVAFR